MANIYGDNYTKEFLNVPSERASVGEYKGKVKVLFDKISAGAAGDVLSIGKLPAGARVLAVDSVNGDNPSCNVAKGDSISSETTVQFTLGAAPAANIKAWVLFVMD